MAARARERWRKPLQAPIAAILAFWRGPESEPSVDAIAEQAGVMSPKEFERQYEGLFLPYPVLPGDSGDPLFYLGVDLKRSPKIPEQQF
jgi:hypothetical protein